MVTFSARSASPSSLALASPASSSCRSWRGLSAFALRASGAVAGERAWRMTSTQPPARKRCKSCGPLSTPARPSCAEEAALASSAIAASPPASARRGRLVIRRSERRSPGKRPVRAGGVGVAAGLLLAPGPVQSEVAIGLRMAGHAVPETEQQLEGRLAEVMIAAEVHHRGPVVERCGRPFRAVIPDLSAERPLLPHVPLQQPAGIGKALVVDLAHELIARAAVGRPRPPVLLDPDRQLVPDLADAEAARGAAGRQLDHGEGSDLRPGLGLTDEPVFDPELR